MAAECRFLDFVIVILTVAFSVLLGFSTDCEVGIPIV